MHQQQRIPWVDVAKGVGIILVTFGHIRNGDGRSVWLPALDGTIEAIYLFHMPLFFFLGGLTFSTRLPFRQFAGKKARELLVPYYVFSSYFVAKPIALLIVPSLAGALQVDREYSLGHQLYDVLINGNGLWFLWAYFVGELLVFGIVKLLGQNRLRLVLTGVSLLAAYFATRILWPTFTLPFQILAGLEVSGFILLGMALNPTLLRLPRRYAPPLFAVATAGFSVFAVSSLGPDFTVTSISRIIAMFFGIAAAVFLAISVSGNRALAHIGQRSITFYALNAVVLNVGKLLLFNVLAIESTTASTFVQWLLGLGLTLLSLIILWFADIAIRRWAPWAIGIRSNRRNPTSQGI